MNISDQAIQNLKIGNITPDAVYIGFTKIFPTTHTLIARCTNYTMAPAQVFINDEHAVTIDLGTKIEKTLQVQPGDKVTFRLTSREADLTVASNNSKNPDTYPYWSPADIQWFKDTNPIYGSSYVAYSFYMPESDAEVYVRYGTGVIT